MDARLTYRSSRLAISLSVGLALLCGMVLAAGSAAAHTTYTYDALGRLVRAENEEQGAAIIYVYDKAGNVLKVKVDGDADGDGVFDSVDNCVDDANADQTDTDNDGDGDACDDDDDDDGMPDSFETAHGLDPLDAADAALDGDGDGLTNLEEFQQGTDPTLVDTDFDGMSDSDEIAAGRDPTLSEPAVLLPAIKAILD